MFQHNTNTNDIYIIIEAISEEENFVAEELLEAKFEKANLNDIMDKHISLTNKQWRNLFAVLKHVKSLSKGRQGLGLGKNNSLS